MSSHRHFKSKAFTVNLIILGSSLAEMDQYTAGKNWPRLLRSSEFDHNSVCGFMAGNQHWAPSGYLIVQKQLRSSFIRVTHRSSCLLSNDTHQLTWKFHIKLRSDTKFLINLLLFIVASILGLSVPRRFEMRNECPLNAHSIKSKVWCFCESSRNVFKDVHLDLNNKENWIDKIWTKIEGIMLWYVDIISPQFLPFLASIFVIVSELTRILQKKTSPWRNFQEIWSKLNRCYVKALCTVYMTIERKLSIYLSFAYYVLQ